MFPVGRADGRHVANMAQNLPKSDVCIKKPKGCSMKDIQNRKQLADLYRKLASVPTEGGHQADLVLLRLAEELELEIASADNGDQKGSQAFENSRVRRPQA